jgi:hypothetical protein
MPADGREYTVTWDAATGITVAIDIFEILPASNKPVFMEELTIWQTSDFKDVEEEILQIQVLSGLTTSGSGGAAATVGKRPGDSAAGFTAECRNTTLATTGTAYIEHADGWNVRAPYIWTPLENWRPMGTSGAPLYVRLPVAPVDSLTMNAHAKLRELG